MIRILHVFGLLGRGGAETMIMNYYRKIDRTKIQFDFVVHTSEEGVYEKEIQELGGKIFRVSRFKGYNYLKYQSEWRKLLKDNIDYQTIHFHFSSIAGVALPVARNMKVKRLIVHCHTVNPKYSIFKYLSNLFLNRQAKKYTTDRFACGDDAGKYYWGNLGFTVMNNAIDASKFIFNNEINHTKRIEFNMCDKFVIGHVGRFNEPKNHTFIIDVFNEVHKQQHNSVLLLIGCGPLEEQIREKISQLTLFDSVVFAGSRADIPELMMAMDVFLFPSLWEGLPVCIVEAQASGLPIVMSDTITKKVILTPLVDVVSLQENVSIWANKVLVKKTRMDTFKQICDSGYDIYDNVKWLEKFYLETTSI